MLQIGNSTFNPLIRFDAETTREGCNLPSRRKKRSGGGAATTAGTTFQEDVACYFSTLILAESASPTPFGLPQDVTLCDITAESNQPIDDLQLRTSNEGLILLQAKANPALSANYRKDFGKAIKQFVTQFVNGVEIGDKVRPLDGKRDRFVLVVSHKAPATIAVCLKAALNTCRHSTASPDPFEFMNLLNSNQYDAITVVRKHLQHCWKELKGTTLTSDDELALLRLIHVLQLDLTVDGTSFDRAHSYLRQVILADERQAADAWAHLVSICRTFSPNRTGGNLTYLRDELANKGVQLKCVNSFRSDIDLLCEYSQVRRSHLRRRSFLEVEGQRIEIARPVVASLAEFAAAGDVVVVGTPGAGKSACLFRVAEFLQAASKDVLLIAADSMGRVSSPEDLSRHFGLSRGRQLVEVLQNWSGSEHAYLIVDAMDAARAALSLKTLCDILRDIRERAPRWRIIVSIRKYDLQASNEVQKLFRGTPHTYFADPDFANIRHVHIERLSNDELMQVTRANKTVRDTIVSVPRIADLVRNVFNLGLLCDLLSQGVKAIALAGIHTQLGLLDAYWDYRVEQFQPLQRTVVLTKVVEAMVASRELTVSRIALADAVAANLPTLEALLSDEVLIPFPKDAHTTQSLAFSHNLFFDYAVYRLNLKGLNNSIVASFSSPEHQDLLIAIRPSIVMAFESLWGTDLVSRSDFWSRAEAFERQPKMRLIGKIIAPGVAATQFRDLADVEPILGRVGGGDETAVSLFRFTVQSALCVNDSVGGVMSLVGAGAANWMGLAVELCNDLKSFSWEVQSLLLAAIKQLPTATTPQIDDINRASQKLARFGMSESHAPGLITPIIDVLSATIKADETGTIATLSELLIDDRLAAGAHEWFSSLAGNLDTIAAADAAFAVRVTRTLFSTVGDRNSRVTRGGQIFALSFDTYDLIESAKRRFAEKYSELWAQNHVLATRLAIIAVDEMIDLKHKRAKHADSDIQFSFQGSTATIRPDASHIWASGMDHQHDVWHKVLTQLREGIIAFAIAPIEMRKLDEVLNVLRDEAKYAIFWRVLLEGATASPTTLGMQAIDLLASEHVLAQSDLHKCAADLIVALYPHLSPEQRLTIEAAILRVPDAIPELGSSVAKRTRDELIGCLPWELICSSEIRGIREYLEQTASVPRIEPVFSDSSATLAGPNDNLWFELSGINRNKSANQPLFEHHALVSKIGNQAQTDDSIVSEHQATLQLLTNAEQAINIAAEAGADQPLIDRLRNGIVGACVRLGQRKGLHHEMSLVQFMTRTLLKAAESPEPAPSDEDNDRWDDDTPFWSAEQPRIQAAMGLMCLAFSPDTATQSVVAQIAKLSDDPVPAVRYQVIYNCLWLKKTATHMMWSIIEKTCRSEQRTAIVKSFVGHVLFGLECEDKRVVPLARVIYRRCRRVEKLRSVRRNCASYYLRLSLSSPTLRYKRYVMMIAANPSQFHDEATTIIHKCRELIRFNKNADATSNADIRKTAFVFLTRVVVALLDRARALREDFSHVAYDQWPQDGIEEFQRIRRLAHELATEVYFGVGAYDAKIQPPDTIENRAFLVLREKQVILDEGKELFEALSKIQFVDAAYDILQTFEFLMPAGYSETIVRISSLIRSAAVNGIHNESMVEDVIVRIVERYLAESSSLFRENPEAQIALLDILDVFVGAGWPKATTLTYRLSDIFR